VTASEGPRYREPIAMALSSSGCVQSRKTNVARWRTGKVGMKRTKNMCKHSSKKTDVMLVDSAAAVTLEDC
jgi:hypothetical protein